MWKKKSIYLLTAAAFAASAATANADDEPAPEKVPSAAAVKAALQSGVPLSSNTIADIAQAVAPAVVNIDVREEVAQRVMTMPDFQSLFVTRPSNSFITGSSKILMSERSPTLCPRCQS